MIYKTHHSLADGLSMLNILSKAQDGGEQAHRSKGIRFPPKQTVTQLEVLKNLRSTLAKQKNDFEYINNYDETSYKKAYVPIEKYDRRIYVSENMSVAEIKKNAKRHGATFNEFLTANLIRSIAEYSDGKDIGKRLNVATVVSMHEAKTVFDEPFRPLNKISGCMSSFEIKSDMSETIEEVKKGLAPSKDPLLLSTGIAQF